MSMNLKMRELLIDLARHPRKNYIHYQELCKACGLSLDMSIPFHRKQIGDILGEISAFEYKKGRPLLSSLVLSKNFGEGDGYYKLCEELGMGNWKKLKQDVAFSTIKMQECISFWKDDSNYIKCNADISE